MQLPPPHNSPIPCIKSLGQCTRISAGTERAEVQRLWADPPRLLGKTSRGTEALSLSALRPGPSASRDEGILGATARDTEPLLPEAYTPCSLLGLWTLRVPLRLRREAERGRSRSSLSRTQGAYQKELAHSPPWQEAQNKEGPGLPE